MPNSRDFFFNKTDLFEKLKRIEAIVDPNGDFNIDEIRTKINNIEQAIEAINQAYASKTYVDNRLIQRVNKLGDSLLGNLSLLVEPIEENHVVNKRYVDNIIAGINQLDLTLLATKDYVNNQIVNRVSKFGDRMYGELILANDATDSFHPISKRQFDSFMNSVAVTRNLDW